MELKEGYYLRTKQGEIHKIKSINDEYIEYENGFGVPYDLKDYYIVEVSNNIIDLIEVGDYVNGHPVTLICEDEVHPQNKCLRIYGRGYVWQKGIKSIVTKEMFESVSYKVGD